ncbi:MAG TPA: response regulator [Thermoanaerobaculia bacterium]
MTLRLVERVLIAAHDAGFAASLVEMLGPASVETRIVDRASFIIATIALFEPDVVIVELEMPDLDGVTACRLMRAKSRVPMLFTSDDVLVVPITGPACALLSKTFTPTDLENALRWLGLSLLEGVACRSVN